MNVHITTYGVRHRAPHTATPDVACDLTGAITPIGPWQREHTGHDTDVRDTVMASPGALAIVRNLVRRTKAALTTTRRDVTVHVYDVNGRHRAVAIAEALARVLALDDTKATIEHLHIQHAAGPTLHAPWNHYIAPRRYTARRGDPPPVLLAGDSANTTWHPEATAVLLSAGALVLTPGEQQRPDLHRSIERLDWERHHLRQPGALTLYWLPARPADVDLVDLGTTLADPDRQILIGVDRNPLGASELVHRIHLARPGQPIHRHLDDLLEEAINHSLHCHVTAPLQGDSIP